MRIVTKRRMRSKVLPRVRSGAAIFSYVAGRQTATPSRSVVDEYTLPIIFDRVAIAGSDRANANHARRAYANDAGGQVARKPSPPGSSCYAFTVRGDSGREPLGRGLRNC